MNMLQSKKRLGCVYLHILWMINFIKCLYFCKEGGFIGGIKAMYGVFGNY